MEVTVTEYILHILQALYEKCIYWTVWHISNIVDLNIFMCQVQIWAGTLAILANSFCSLPYFLQANSGALHGLCRGCFLLYTSHLISCYSSVLRALLNNHQNRMYNWLSDVTHTSELCMVLPLIRFGLKLKCEYYKRLLERAFVSVAQKDGKSDVGLAAITCIKCTNFHSPWFFILPTSCFCLIKSESLKQLYTHFNKKGLPK